jgi:hypothetical protein
MMDFMIEDRYFTLITPLIMVTLKIGGLKVKELSKQLAE